MILQAIILGIVQGLTEFLPISSSGHLALLERVFQVSEPVTIAAFLHMGTLLATVAYFFKPLVTLLRGVIKGDQKKRAYLFSIIIGSIPIVIAGFLLRASVDRIFHDPQRIALLIGMTGVILLVTAVIKKGEGRPTPLSGLLIGIAQMFALLPGISRSGMTIATGLYAKIKPEEAFTFSFLLSLPAVFGANIIEMRTLTSLGDCPSIIIGVVCSFISGIIALKILRRTVHKYFHLFGIYCLIISIILLFLV